MPLISSSGFMSSRGFGQFRFIPSTPIAFGTLGVFRGGTQSGFGGVSIYNFATKAMVNSFSMAAETNQTAFGTAEHAIYTGSTAARAVKYTFSRDAAVTAPGAATITTDRGGCLSNGVTAIITSAKNNSNTQIYTFTSDLTVSGPSLLSSSNYSSGAAGNKTVGFVPLANFSTGANKYDYAANTFTSAAAARAVSGVGAACGISEYGIFAHGGSTSSGTDKRVYATGVVSAGTNLKTVIYYGSVCGSDTYALFSGGGAGYSDITSTYNYSDDTTVLGTLLKPDKLANASAASNGVTGVNL